MTEREIKVILSENEYMALIMTFCRYQMSKIQVNYYFDTDELLMNKNGITCRIRLKDGIYKATVKCRSKDDPEVSTEYDIYEGKSFDPQVFGALGLKCHGELVTERYTLCKNDKVEVVLDCNVYLDRNDFELEIEYSDGCRKWAEKELENIAKFLESGNFLTDKSQLISRAEGVKSKSARFFKAKQI